MEIDAREGNTGICIVVVFSGKDIKGKIVKEIILAAYFSHGISEAWKESRKVSTKLLLINIRGSLMNEWFACCSRAPAVLIYVPEYVLADAQAVLGDREAANSVRRDEEI